MEQKINRLCTQSHVYHCAFAVAPGKMRDALGTLCELAGDGMLVKVVLVDA